MKDKLQFIKKSSIRMLICILCVCSGTFSAFAQGEKPISGNVADDKGEAVIGASVAVKGTKTGTVADMNGNFSLTAAPDAVLVISYLGFKTQEVAVGGRTNITVTLIEDTQSLDEVVVVGYGTQRKIDLAGSVVRADLSTLRETPSINLMSSLQGTVPGLNVGAVTQAGANPEVTIRGRNSINGSLNPLIVLDGIIFNGDMVDINPNDIESMDILKDASAAAVYGVQSANGVILITSKQGKLMSKPTVSYSASYSAQRVAKPYDLMNGDEFLKMLADCNLESSRMLGSKGEPLPQMVSNFDYANYIAGATTRQGYQDGVNNNWLDMFSDNNPHIQQHDINVRRRNENVGYFFSAGYLAESARQSLKDLQLDYLDLYLVHWPFPNHHAPGVTVESRDDNAKPYIHEDYMQTWRAMEKLVDEGLVRHIGTSNMTVPKLELLLRDCRIKPACNEMEMHPHFQQPELFDFVNKNGMAAIGYCPIGSPNRPERDKTAEDTVPIEDPVIVTIAQAHNIHPAVVCIKWAVQNGQIPIPFSVKPEKFMSNLRATTEDPLTEDEMKAIKAIDKNNRFIKGQVFTWKGATWEDLWK